MLSQALRECSDEARPCPVEWEEQNWLMRLMGGLPAKANLPSLVDHWLMIHAVLVPGRRFELVVTSGVR